MTLPLHSDESERAKVQAAEKAYQEANARALKALAEAEKAWYKAKLAAEEAYDKAIKESEK